MIPRSVIDGAAWADRLTRLAFVVLLEFGGSHRANSDPISLVYLELFRRISRTGAPSSIYSGHLGAAVSEE